MVRAHRKLQLIRVAIVLRALARGPKATFLQTPIKVAKISKDILKNRIIVRQHILMAIDWVEDAQARVNGLEVVASEVKQQEQYIEQLTAMIEAEA